MIYLAAGQRYEGEAGIVKSAVEEMEMEAETAPAPETARRPDWRVRDTLWAAFPYTIPVMTGYLFMGMAFGILLETRGYGPAWAGLMSVLIYAGSMQFVAVGVLADTFAPLAAFLLTLMVNARHVFYGFSLLDKYRGLGRIKPYLVFALTDETFSLLCSIPPPAGLNRGAFYLAVSALNQSYWITGCVTGAFLGSSFSFDVQGLDFAMTALFVAIFVEQWRAPTNRRPGLAGLAATALCLAVFGPHHFILPAMALLIAGLTLSRRALSREDEA